MRHLRKRLLVALLAACGSLVGLNQVAEKTHADIFQIEYIGGSDFDPLIAPIAQAAGQWWNDRFIGWNNDLPDPMKAQMAPVITATINLENVDGVGGVLAFAAPEEVLVYTGPRKYGGTFAVAQTGFVTADLEDFDEFATQGRAGALAMLAILVHELGHVAGGIIQDTIAIPNGVVDPENR